MKNPRLLIFDLDGTLIDSRLDVTSAFNRVMKSRGIPAVAEECIASYIGTGVRPLLAKTAATYGHTDLGSLYEEFDTVYEGCLLENTTLYSGIAEVLSSLDLVTKVVLTNKYQRFVDPILKGLGVTHYFRYAFGREAFPSMKPDPLPVLLACKACDTDPSDTLVIGDTPTDIQAAKAAGVASCAVFYGYGRADELRALNPEFEVENAKQMLELFSSEVGAFK